MKLVSAMPSEEEEDEVNREQNRRRQLKFSLFYLFIGFLFVFLHKNLNILKWDIIN